MNACANSNTTLAEELWTRWPKEHRFGMLLVECLGPLRQLARRRAAIEELARRIERFQAEAKTELAKLEQQKAAAPAHPDVTTKSEQMDPSPQPSPLRKGRGRTPRVMAPARCSPAAQKSEEPSDLSPPTRAQFEERQLRELSFGRPLQIEWFLVSQALLEKKPAEARHHLEKLTQAGAMNHELSQRVAGALAELGDLEPARELLEAALEFDPENALVMAQLAGIHFAADRFDEAIGSAADSLSLLYFQPGVHALLGQALMETRRYTEAEQELRVAVAQSPRNLAAHELLATLYGSHLNRPSDAFAHEGRARSLRHELAEQKRAGANKSQSADASGNVRGQAVPAPFCNFFPVRRGSGSAPNYHYRFRITA